MRFACESCGSRYRLADEKVRGLLVEVRCRSCAAIVTLRDGVPEPAGGAGNFGALAADPARAAARVDPASSPSTAPSTGPSELANGVPASKVARAAAAPSMEPPPPPPPPHERLWFALVAGKQEGPLSDDALEREIAGGRVVATTFVWHEGMADWKRLADVPR